MTKELNAPLYDCAVVIGRFQPVHNAHLWLIEQAATLSNNVIIIVGSVDQPRTFENPFSFAERKEMLQRAIYWAQSTGAIPSVLRGKEVQFHIEPNIDTVYNDDAWVIRVQEIVQKHNHYSVIEPNKVALVGHEKDSTSYYLKKFPQWHTPEFPALEKLSATEVRKLYFTDRPNLNFIKGVVPPPILTYLDNFVGTEGFTNVKEEKQFEDLCKKQYEHLQYEPHFVTGDAVVVQSGHIVLVERKPRPGKGLWALPGGFLRASLDNSLLDCALRELKEETKIKVSPGKLRSSVARSQVFDAIRRSSRGRTVTQAFYIPLPDGPLPGLKASDDARDAKWVPLSQVKREVMFEDHYDIIKYFTA
jgi:bifunctional NMN adenylyltransferase/nudix hydrolase